MDDEVPSLAGGFTVEPPETNLLYLRVNDAAAWEARLATMGVRAFAVGVDRMRMVFHQHITDDDCAYVRDVMQAVSRVYTHTWLESPSLHQR